MQVSRFRRQLLRDFQRLGCGHAPSACGGKGKWVLRGAAAGEDAEERNAGIAQKSTGGETKGTTKRAP